MGEVVVPVDGEVSLVGMPRWKVMVMSSGWLGAEVMGSAVSFHCERLVRFGDDEMMEDLPCLMEGRCWGLLGCQLHNCSERGSRPWTMVEILWM